MSQHLTPELIDRLDAELGAAIRAVETGLATTATVALAFAVGLDDDAHPEVTFTHRGSVAKKGRFSPPRQLRLDLEDAEEARR